MTEVYQMHCLFNLQFYFPVPCLVQSQSSDWEGDSLGFYPSLQGLERFCDPGLPAGERGEWHSPHFPQG